MESILILFNHIFKCSLRPLLADANPLLHHFYDGGIKGRLNGFARSFAQEAFLRKACIGL